MALWGIFFTIIPLLLVGGLILAGAGLARKDEYDPRRVYVVYLVSTIAVSLVLLVAGVTVMVGSIGHRIVGTNEIGLDPGGGMMVTEDGSFEMHSEDNDFGDRYATSEAIQAALVAGVGLLLLYFHATRLASITRSDGFASSVIARTYAAYLYLVCFAAVVTAVVSGAMTLYALVRVAAPGSIGTFPEGMERDLAVVDLARFGVLAGLNAWIFRWHWGAAERQRPA